MTEPRNETPGVFVIGHPTIRPPASAACGVCGTVHPITVTTARLISHAGPSRPLVVCWTCYRAAVAELEARAGSPVDVAVIGAAEASRRMGLDN